MQNTEVVTVADKQTRDRMYESLRASDDPCERQVVRFSAQEPVLLESGEQDVHLVWYGTSKKSEQRPVWRPTWSVAYPRS